MGIPDRCQIGHPINWKFTADRLNDETALLWLAETWPEILRLAWEKRAIILFGDEASFAQWGSLGYSWAIKGIHATVKTSGIRKAFRVFGLLDCFGGKLFFAALVAKVTEMLTKFAGLPHELTALAGAYRELTPLAA